MKKESIPRTSELLQFLLLRSVPITSCSTIYTSSVLLSFLFLCYLPLPPLVSFFIPAVSGIFQLPCQRFFHHSFHHRWMWRARKDGEPRQSRGGAKAKLGTKGGTQSSSFGHAGPLQRPPVFASGGSVRCTYTTPRPFLPLSYVVL